MHSSITTEEREALKEWQLYLKSGELALFDRASSIAESIHSSNPTSVIANFVLQGIFEDLKERKDVPFFEERARFHQRMYQEFSDDRLDKLLTQSSGSPEEVLAISREEVPKLKERFPEARFYDTSTHAPLAGNYNFIINASEFSPFKPYGGIPVPKQEEFSDSVEGIWQGLKIIKGKTDFNYFKGKGRKRYGHVTGHLLGDKSIPYDQARKDIYVPSYSYMLDTYLCDQVEEIIERSSEGIRQFFFDVDSNTNMHNLDSPLAHSAALTEYINFKLQSR